jgi:hypothetical protein
MNNRATQNLRSTGSQFLTILEVLAASIGTLAIALSGDATNFIFLTAIERRPISPRIRLRARPLRQSPPANLPAENEPGPTLR